MIQIKGKTLDFPLIQGGMGVGISLGSLAGAVAAQGCMGVISTINPGYGEFDFYDDPAAANRRALTREIRHARVIAGGRGMVAINAMVATTSYEDCIKTAVEAGVDAIISGAGLPGKLPGLVKDADVALAPIVSSGRAAALICRLWQRHHGVTPDFIVIEGPQAGGHLGFDRASVLNGEAPALAQILPDVLEAIVPAEQQAGRAIPVFVAGGVFSGKDLAYYQNLGAAGVQIATRFIATEECDASQAFKDQIIAARADDAVIVQSPVGMPGRALNTALVQAVAEGQTFPAQKCIRCLVPCNPAKTPYCISQALIAAVQGDAEKGLFFCGSNVGRITAMTTVPKLIEEIKTEWRQFS